jgi:hypothetical protein
VISATSAPDSEARRSHVVDNKQPGARRTTLRRVQMIKAIDHKKQTAASRHGARLGPLCAKRQSTAVDSRAPGRCAAPVIASREPMAHTE